MKKASVLLKTVGAALIVGFIFFLVWFDQKFFFRTIAWNKPDNWYVENRCQGLIFYHPPELNVPGLIGSFCSLQTPGKSISISARETSISSESKTAKVQRILVDGVVGKKIIEKNEQGDIVGLQYVFPKWNHYYIFSVNLEDIDHTLAGSYRLYKKRHGVTELALKKEAGSSEMLSEYMKFIDYIVSTIRFIPPKEKTPNF